MVHCSNVQAKLCKTLKTKNQKTANDCMKFRGSVVQFVSVAHPVLASWLWFHYWQNTCKGRLLWPLLACFPESGYCKTDTH